MREVVVVRELPLESRRLPERLRPMLPTPLDEPFDSPDHLFDVSWGGVRVLLLYESGGVTLRGRNGVDLTPRFPELQALARVLRGRDLILDGEIVALDEKAHPEVTLLRYRLGPRPFRERTPVTFLATDILHLDGRPLLSRPLEERKRLLLRTLPASDLAAPAEFVEGEGIAFYQAAVEQHLPGVIAKARRSPYFPGRRSADWLELRVYLAGEFVVGGFSLDARGRLEGLLVGIPEREGLRYAGRVLGSFDDGEARELLGLLQPLVVPKSPFLADPGIPQPVCWCRPVVVVEVHYGGWSPQSTLRFPLFAIPRPDISPRDCAAAPGSLAVS